MIDERIFKIELRQGKERSIKSYVLRSNVLDDKGERIIEDSKDSLIFYEEGSRLNSESLSTHLKWHSNSQQKELWRLHFPKQDVFFLSLS